MPNALHAFASNCDNLPALESTISRIAYRHLDMEVQDLLYPMLEECFIEALRLVNDLQFHLLARCDVHLHWFLRFFRNIDLCIDIALYVL